MTSASRETGNPAASSQTAEQGDATAAAAVPLALPASEVAAVEARRNPSQVLIALPGIKATTIPSEVSLNRLEQFLRDNQPCDPRQVGELQ